MVAKKTSKKTTKKPVTFVGFVIDRSGSMLDLAPNVTKLYNSLLTKQQGIPDQEIYGSLVTFSSNITSDVPIAHVDSLKPLTRLHTGGGTRLYDAMVYATEQLKNAPGAKAKDASLLLIVITDGYENESVDYCPTRHPNKFKNYIRDALKEKNITIAVNVPPKTAASFANESGIPIGNIREWELTSTGVKETEEKTSGGISTYFAARSKGTLGVSNFYTVNANLHNLKKSTVRKNLDNVTANFKGYEVKKECEIREFVEEKTKKPYVVGSAYYSLSKPELVQAKKKVLIREKGKPEIFGGDGARELIGLPTDGVSKAKLNPVDLSKYEIYVASTSVNRKLVRGTFVIVDMKKVLNDVPTWDHTTV